MATLQSYHQRDNFPWHQSEVAQQHTETLPLGCGSCARQNVVILAHPSADNTSCHPSSCKTTLIHVDAVIHAAIESVRTDFLENEDNSHHLLMLLGFRALL